jgi:hypothetical protein
MTPSKGRIVHVIVDPKTNNGDDYAPAIITRVCNEQAINARVLLDGPDTPWVTSVPLYESREALESADAQSPALHLFGAFWPPRA